MLANGIHKGATMKTEEEVREELEKFKKCLKDREVDSRMWHLDYGYIMALEWVLEEICGVVIK